MNDGRLVILAGGISSRMRRPAQHPDAIPQRLLSEAGERPKSMLSVGAENRPFLDYLLYNARMAGYRDIVLIIGERDFAVREYYGAADRGNPFHGLRISYAVQSIPAGRKKPLGTADALARGLDAVPEWEQGSFTVCNSDNLYSVRALQLMREEPAPCAMIDYDRSALSFSQDRIEQFAVVRKDSEGYLIDIIEKPSAEEVAQAADAKGRIGVSMNIFRLSYDLIHPRLDHVPLHPVRQERELPTAVRSLILEQPRCMRAIPLAEHVPDLTHRDDIPDVQRFLRDAYPRFDWME